MVGGFRERNEGREACDDHDHDDDHNDRLRLPTLSLGSRLPDALAAPTRAASAYLRGRGSTFAQQKVGGTCQCANHPHFAADALDVK